MIHEKDASDAASRRPSRGEGPGRERSGSPGAVPLRRTPLRRSPGGEQGAGGAPAGKAGAAGSPRWEKRDDVAGDRREGEPAPSLPAQRTRETGRETGRQPAGGGLWRRAVGVAALILAGVLLFVLGFLTALVLTGALFGPHA